MRSNWRGSGRGRGSHSARRGSSWSKQAPAVTESPPPRLGDLIAKLYLDELQEDSEAESARITDVQHVTSYSWLKREKPTILVPGKPRTWTPLSSPVRLAEDAGLYFRDRNAARFPAHPMQPTAEVILNHGHVDQTNPPAGQIDLVACSSTMGNLLRFVRGQEKSFRMLVEVIGSTVFLVRREKSPTEYIPGVYGYGHTFPEAYTRWDPGMEGSETHHRVIRYQFAGLDCAVRFEVDGYLPSYKPGTSEKNHDAADDEDAVISALEGGLARTHLTSNKSQCRETSNHGSALEIVHAESPISIPQSTIFDLKTRSVRKKELDTLGDEMPRLWVSQIPHFILAYHKAGVFEEIQIKDVRDNVAEWERENEHHLRRFATLLRKIISFARSRVKARLELCRPEGSRDAIEIREQCDDVGTTLPKELTERWVSDSSVARVVTVGAEDDGETQSEEAPLKWEEDSDDDFTACTEKCGYCGRCKH